ncbi:MAG: hypothetical protein HKM91_05060 [Altererythrobacter sp.]|nr:hypothetical protein [Altererythrobacter sp.]
MTDRWFYLFIAFVALGSTGGWLFIRNVEFVRETWLLTLFDVGAVVGFASILLLLVQRLRGAFND